MGGMLILREGGAGRGSCIIRRAGVGIKGSVSLTMGNNNYNNIHKNKQEPEYGIRMIQGFTRNSTL